MRACLLLSPLISYIDFFCKSFNIHNINAITSNGFSSLFKLKTTIVKLVSNIECNQSIECALPQFIVETTRTIINQFINGHLVSTFINWLTFHIRIMHVFNYENKKYHNHIESFIIIWALLLNAFFLLSISHVYI